MLLGGAIWHPRCGPGPTENGTVLNGSALLENGHCTDTDGEMSAREGREGREFDRMSSSAVSETQVHRARWQWLAAVILTISL